MKTLVKNIFIKILFLNNSLKINFNSNSNITYEKMLILIVKISKSFLEDLSSATYL